jgi:Arc/MetJ-type ribon-helix-helix transcriptional regulator
MDRVEAYVPPPLEEGIENHRESNGFENRSQAIRDLLRQGLECEKA